MRKGTMITCCDAEDLECMLKELNDAGYGTEIRDRDKHIIVITSVPEEERT